MHTILNTPQGPCSLLLTIHRPLWANLLSPCHLTPNPTQCPLMRPHIRVRNILQYNSLHTHQWCRRSCRLPSMPTRYSRRYHNHGPWTQTQLETDPQTNPQHFPTVCQIFPSQLIKETHHANHSAPPWLLSSILRLLMWKAWIPMLWMLCVSDPA